MRRILNVLFISFAMCLCIKTASYAENACDKETGIDIHINEYDYILAIQNMNTEELAELGMTQNDSDCVVTEFYEALNSRAALSEEILIGYGYTKEMISVLKKFSASCDRSSLSDEEIRSIAGTCSGVITSDYFHGRYARVIYNWSWDHCPIMTLSDSAAMRWLAFTDGGSSVDVGWNIIEKNIDYYCNGTFMFQKHGTLEPNLEFYGLNLQFAMNEPFIMPDATISYAYAKEGEIEIEVYLEIEVVPSVSISYLRVAALYGHSTLGPGEPSIGLSPEGGISIGFSGNWAIDPIAGHKVKISVNPDYDYYHPIITPIN